MKRQMQKGFTLIELMIVVAIIGILAAIALPAYQDYTYRSKYSEGAVLMGNAKTQIEEYTQVNGALPTTAASAGITSLTGNNVDGIIYTYTDTSNAYLTAYFDLDSNGVSEAVNLNALRQTAGNITWTITCTVADAMTAARCPD
ncbi:MAG: prepilin-type N-terminal cleavage/methylation domain-containing protein [Oceanospirillaceae bacterium]|nr:prepilin-type N-terminal cleavage/methylation domain-containing protein [Oceanospirillaceae bacterium]